MNKQKFDTIVKNKANANVQARIVKFKEDIKNAFRGLSYGFEVGYPAPLYCGDDGKSQDAKHRMVRTTIKWLMGLEKGLPSEIWQLEEEDVADAILKQMDAIQAALVARGELPDDVPMSSGEDPGSAESI